MAASLCQSVLDALTDIDMPKRHPARTTQGSIEADGIWLPVYACDALVLGHAKSPRRHIRVLGIGRADPAYGCDRPAWRSRLPRPSALAAPWTKIRPMWKRWDRCALSSLQYLGLPVPLDRLGAALRYQTDHDEAGRATSCGPRTSRLMVKVLAEESARLGVPVLNRCVGAKILAAGEEPKRVMGLLAFHTADRTAKNPLGLAIIRCADLVIAAGGPGELYRDSVYPKHCFGALGLALEAGVEAINLTESQFGIGTPRDGSPWNLSGTYAQCLPYIHSVDTDGIGAQFPGRLLSNDTGTRPQHFPQGLSMAVPCLTNARLRFQPCRIDRATYPQWNPL